jgi:hypothetical protein
MQSSCSHSPSSLATLGDLLAALVLLPSLRLLNLLLLQLILSGIDATAVD